MTQPSPADELRAAADVLRQRVAVGGFTGTRAAAALLRARDPLVTLLDTAAAGLDVYPEMGDDHDREACADYACDLVGAALAVARAINGDTP